MPPIINHFNYLLNSDWCGRINWTIKLKYTLQVCEAQLSYYRMHSLCLESRDSTQLLMGSPAPTTPPTCTMQPYQGWQLCGTTKYIPRMGCRMLHHWCICSRQCPEHNMVVMYVGESAKGHTHHYTTTLNHQHMQLWWWNLIPQNTIYRVSNLLTSTQATL